MKQSGNNVLLSLIAILALVGLFDATYLTVEHYLNAIPTCLVATGCETVLTSRFATIGSIPIALIGAAYYLVLFILALASMGEKSPPTPLSQSGGLPPLQRGIEGDLMQWLRQPFNLLLGLTTLGFLSTLGLVYLQAQVLRAFCTYCLVSAGTSTIIFALLSARAVNTRRVY